MIHANQDLQASYQIISLLERSKRYSESIIDEFPEFFAVIDSEGEIISANKHVADVFNTSVENVLRLQLSTLFSQEKWQVYRMQIEKLIQDPKQKVHFDLPLDAKEHQLRFYTWSLMPFQVGPGFLNNLVCVIGRDISLQLDLEGNVKDFLEAIPLGILLVNLDGLVGNNYSSYAQMLLGGDALKGKSLNELIFEPCKEYMDAQQRDAWKSLFDFSTLSPKEFDILFSNFPGQIFLPNADLVPVGGRYLGVKVQSIIKNGKINGLLVILEDRTSLILEEKNSKEKDILRDVGIERAVALRRTDSAVIKIIISDFKTLFHQVGEALFARDLNSFSQILHAIKGNARLAGFQQLMKLTHNLESMIQESPNKEWNLIYFQFDEIRREWQEIQSLAQILLEEQETKQEEDFSFERNTLSLYEEYQHIKQKLTGTIQTEELAQLEKMIRSISFNSLVSLESLLRQLVQRTATQLNKNVKLHFFCDAKIQVLEHHFFIIRTCLMHLLTNAVDHGIESSEERAQKKKPSFGNLKVDIYTIANRLVIQVEDDGRGLDLQNIKDTAVKKKLITPADLVNLTEEQVVQLVFLPGFSTASQVSVTSGRGVGLDSVKAQVEKLHGYVSVTNSKAGGAFFQCILKVEMILAEKN